MRTVLDLQFFQCVGEGRAVSWYARRGALTIASCPKAPQRAQQRQAARLRSRCTKAIGGVVFVSSVGGGGGRAWFCSSPLSTE